MDKRKEYKIIPVEFVDIEDGDYILNSSDGEEYRVTGDISTKKGSMIRVHDDTFLKLTNDIERNNLEEIVILKDGVKREQFGESNVTSRERLTAVWPNMATKILLDKYKELKPRVLRSEIKSVKHMWELIHEELGINGFHYELQQVESKWKSLKRSYRLRVGGRRKPNSFAAPFDKEIGEILSLLTQNETDVDKVDTSPPPKKSKLTSEGACDNSSSKMDPEEIVSKTIFKLNTEEINKNLSLIVKSIERGTLKREKVEEKKWEQRERLINAIEKGNELLSRLLDKK